MGFAFAIALLVPSLFAAPSPKTSDGSPWTGSETQAAAPTPAATPEPSVASGPADAARLRGRVLEFGQRDSIPNARLVFEDGRAPVDADEDGRFSVELAAGSYALIVRAPGFDDLKTRVQLRPNQDLEMEYRLGVRLAGERYRTVVKVEREAAVSSTKLRAEELRDVPGTGSDPLRSIASLPGAAPVAGFLPYVVVRGASPGNTGYYLDGIRVPILFHAAIGPSVIHPYFIDGVDFYTGGAPARLGRYTNGIIEATTRRGLRDRVHGEFDIWLTHAGGLLEIPFDRRRRPGCKHKRRRKCLGEARGTLTLAGRYSYTGLILSLITDQVRIRFWDYQGRFEHPIGPNLDYVAFAYGSYDDISAFNAEAEELQSVTRFQFHRFVQQLRQKLRRRGTATYALALGVDQAGVGGLANSAVRTDEWRVAPRVDVRLPSRDERFTFGFGLDQEFQLFRLQDDVTSIAPDNIEDYALIFSERNVSATGAYVDLTFEQGNLQIRPGIRADVYVQNGRSPYLPDARALSHAFGIDPRIAIRERLNGRWTLRQNLGLYHQPPSSPIPIPAIESFGFERGLQRNLQASAGYEFSLIEGKLRLEQDAYVGWLSNLQDYELAGEDSQDELEDFITNVNGWAYGLETMLRLDPSLKLFGWAAYTLARSIRNYPLGGYAPSNWDQRHVVNVVLGYRVTHKWRFGGRLHFHTGRPWTAPVDDQSPIDALTFNRNNARLPAFFQLDLRVSRIFRFANWQLEGVIDVANATFSREVIQCSAADGTETAFRDAVIRARANPSRGLARCTPFGFRYVVPSLGLIAKF